MHYTRPNDPFHGGWDFPLLLGVSMLTKSQDSGLHCLFSRVRASIYIIPYKHVLENPIYLPLVGLASL